MAENKIEKAGLADQIPKKRIDKKLLAGELCEKITDLQSDRTVWIARQEKFLTEWDDYISNKRAGAWTNASNFHLPITMIHCRAMHAKLLRSIFGVRPWFMISPREKLDIDRVKRIEKFMHWALTSYVNNYKGIYLTVDDWLWDIVTVGWGVMKLRWDTQIRKSAFVEKEPIIPFDTAGMTEEEIGAQLSMFVEQGSVEFQDMEKERFVKVFEGPSLETLNHEDILFPGAMNDGSDLDQAHIVAHKIYLTKHDLKMRSMQKIYDAKVVNTLLKGEPDTGTGFEKGISNDIKKIKDHYQGVDTVNAKEREEAYTVHEIYTRMDVDDDGFDEEVVVWLHEPTQQILRWTYLDRISKTGKRPFYKADLIRRPRRSYSIGMVELLHPINREADALHNQRIDFGTISNIPYFFYRAASGLKPEDIRLEPGVGIPVDDVNDVRFASMTNSTNWGFQEEASLNQYAEKLTSITEMSTGNMPSPIGGARTATGMLSLQEQANTQIDVSIKRVHETYSAVLCGIKYLMDERLPEGVEFRVINPDGVGMVDETGAPVTETLGSRFEIQGRVDFELIANSANTNREIEKQNAMLISQLLKNPINIQLGIVGPEQIYNLDKNVLDKHGIMEPDKYLVKPEGVEKPMTMYDEISSIYQGLMPRIILNDNHDVKIQGLATFFNSEVYARAMINQQAHADSPILFQKAIAMHQNMMEVIQAQAQLGNVTGLQISPSLGARVGGQVDQKTGQPVAEAQQPAQQQGQQQMEQAQAATGQRRQ